MAAIINIPPIKSLIDNNSFAKKYEENAAMIISNKKIGLAKTGCILRRPNWIIKVEINNIDPIDKITLPGNPIFLESPNFLLTKTEYQEYRQIVEAAKGRFVTIRTLDIGGDKKLKGVTDGNEQNQGDKRRGGQL